MGDAYSAHYVGGECLQGLKLEVHVLSKLIEDVERATMIKFCVNSCR